MYKSLLLFLFAVAGSVSLNAQVSYYAIEGDAVTEVEPETDYALKNAIVASSDAYVTGTSVSTMLTEDNAYQFEEFGTDDEGYTVYRLKKTTTGEYLEDPDISGGTIAMTTIPGRAFKFTVFTAVVHDTVSTEYLQNPDVEIRSFLYNTTVSDATPVVLCNVNYANSSYDWLTSTSSGGFSWTQTTANTGWIIYGIGVANGYTNLFTVIQEYFNESAPADLFTVGTSFGNVSQELFDALQSAYDSAIALLNETTSVTDEQYQAAADNLYNAYCDAGEGVIGMESGYYIIRNGASDRGNGNALIYDTGSVLYWVEYAYTDSATFDSNHADCIWELSRARGTVGGYYIRNYKTGRYMGSQATTGVAVPTTEGPDQVWYMKVQTGTAYNIYTTNQNTVRPCLHGGSGTPLVVVWGWYATASGWYFQSISQEELDNMVPGGGDSGEVEEDTLTQAELNDSATVLIETAEPALTQGIAIVSEATEDGDMTNAGLVTDGSCFFSNAVETTEGSLDYLIDNDQTTFFHSTWSAVTDPTDLIHNVGADLGKEVQYLHIKYSRRNTGSAGTPLTVRVYACNDTTDAANWVEQGVYTFSYTYTSTTYSSETENFTGLTGVALDAPYRFIRLDVEHTLNDATSSVGNLYFVFSELRFYEGTYDADNSLIEVVPDEVIAELKTQIAATKAELAEELVTETTLAALQAAYDAFVEAYPDVESVTELYAECQEYLDGAMEGTDIGYYEEGSVTAFETALTAVAADIKSVMSVSEISSCITRMNEALAALQAALILPTGGEVYYIRSASTGTPASNYIYAQNTDESVVKWGGAGDANLGDRLNYMWRVIDNTDGTFSLQNLGTGMYLGNPGVNNSDVYMSYEADTVTFKSSKLAGIVNIVFADGIYANLQTGSYEVVSWGSASGTDNSAFEFVETDNSWEGNYHYDIDQKIQVVTLPIDIMVLVMDANFYKVHGKTSTSDEDGTIELTLYQNDEVIPAGTPFVYVPLESANEGATDFTCVALSYDELEYDLTPKTDNGLVGVFQEQSVGNGMGLIFNGFVTLSISTDVVAAGSGYFNESVPTVETSGDYSLPLYGVISDISTVKVSNAEKVDVYTLSGVKVRQGVKAATATSGLPKGIYIVGGKKIFAK